MMRNKIQSQAIPKEFQEVVIQKIFYTNYAAFNRWNDKRKVNVNRNDNDWNDNWWFGGVRNSFISPPTFCLGSFVLQSVRANHRVVYLLPLVFQIMQYIS